MKKFLFLFVSVLACSCFGRGALPIYGGRLDSDLNANQHSITNLPNSFFSREIAVTNLIFSPSSIRAKVNILYEYSDAYMSFIETTIPSGTVFRVATEIEWELLTKKTGMVRTKTLLPPEAFGGSLFSFAIVRFDTPHGYFISPDSMLGNHRAYWELNYASGSTLLSMRPDQTEEYTHVDVWEVIGTQVIGGSIDTIKSNFITQEEYASSLSKYATSNWVESVVAGIAVEEADPKSIHRAGGEMTGPFKLAEVGITFTGVNISTNYIVRAESDGTNTSWNIYEVSK